MGSQFSIGDYGGIRKGGYTPYSIQAKAEEFRKNKAVENNQNLSGFYVNPHDPNPAFAYMNARNDNDVLGKRLNILS